MVLLIETIYVNNIILPTNQRQFSCLLSKVFCRSVLEIAN